MEAQRSITESRNQLTPDLKPIEMKSQMTETKSMGTETTRNFLLLDPTGNTPTIVTSSVTPPAISPINPNSLPLPGTSTSGSSSPVGTPNVNNTPTHPLLTTRRDSTTQVKLNILFKILYAVDMF